MRQEIANFCEHYQQELLDFDLTRERRAGLARLLAHVESCEECRQAAAEFDQVQEVLSQGREEAQRALPVGIGTDGGNEEQQRWEAFEERMLGAIGKKSGRPQGAGRSEMRGWRVAAALVMAAGLGLALGVFSKGSAGPVLGAGGGGGVDVARLSGPELQQHVLAFDNITEAFDHRASWVVFAEGKDSDVGLAPQPMPASVAPLVLRMVVKRNGALASQCDLAIVPGQAADLSLGTTEGKRLKFHVRTRKNDEQQVTVLLELGGTGEGERATLGDVEKGHAVIASTARLDFGVATTVGQVTTLDGTYTLSVGLNAPGSKGREQTGAL
jgi:hypothetical protein